MTCRVSSAPTPLPDPPGLQGSLENGELAAVAATASAAAAAAASAPSRPTTIPAPCHASDLVCVGCRTVSAPTPPRRRSWTGRMRLRAGSSSRRQPSTRQQGAAARRGRRGGPAPDQRASRRVALPSPHERQPTSRPAARSRSMWRRCTRAATSPPSHHPRFLRRALPIYHTLQSHSGHPSHLRLLPPSLLPCESGCSAMSRGVAGFEEKQACRSTPAQSENQLWAPTRRQRWLAKWPAFIRRSIMCPTVRAKNAQIH